MPIGTSLAPYLALVEGSTVVGEIVDFRVQQKSDYDTNRPLYFVRTEGKTTKGFEPFDSDGRPNEPICDWVFTLDVGEEDENGETERRVFLDPRKGQRGSAVEGKRGRDAIEIALKKAKAHRVGLEIGGRISITRGPKMAPKRGDAQCVTYTAEYEPPAGGPGSGTPVDEVPHLIGGERFDPRAREEKAADSSFSAPPVSLVGSATTTSGLGQSGGSIVMSRSASYDEDPPF